MDASVVRHEGDDAVVYDTQSQHGNIDEIKRLAQLSEPSMADTPFLQMAAWSYWNQHRKALLAAPYESPELIRERQLIQVRGLVDYAYRHVPFYRALYDAAGYSPGAIRRWSDFEALPVVTKRSFAEQPTECVLAAGAQGVAKFCTRSSGSSGTPLTTWLDQNDVIRDFAEQTRFLVAATQGRLHENDWIYTLHHGGFWYSSVLGRYRVFRLMDLEGVSALDQHWRLLRPRVVTTLPSYLPLLAGLGSLRRFGIEAVITNSEMSSRQERSRYSRLLDVPLLDEYSSEEIGFIATECFDGAYHVVEDGVYVETLDPDANHIGRVVVTDLGNVLMPLIRYDHGDLASLSDQPCGCGQTFRRLDALQGRRDDAFIAADGRYVPTASLLGVCDTLLTPEGSGMSAYRLVQRSADLVDVHYSALPEGADQVDRVMVQLRDRLSALFGHPVRLGIHPHACLPEAPSYKRRVLLRAWEASR